MITITDDDFRRRYGAASFFQCILYILSRATGHHLSFKGVIAGVWGEAVFTRQGKESFNGLVQLNLQGVEQCAYINS